MTDNQTKLVALPQPARIGDATWMDDALCQGIPTDLFYPEDNQSAVEAKRACALCPVAGQCLDTFIGERHGIFGGTTPRERMALRKTRRLAAA